MIQRYIILSAIIFLSGMICQSALAQESVQVDSQEIVSVDTQEAVPESDKIFITPLFEYPMAPEDLPDLTAKSGWLMDHFWDNLVIKKGESVDQNALNDAFQVYAAAAVYAPRDKVIKSINKLIKSVKGSPVMTLQMAKGAEEAFYGPRAVVWSDEVYMPFVEAVMAEKNISETRKLKYQNQLEIMKRNAIGKKFPELRLTLRDGKHHVYKPSADFTIVEIGDPGCDDCRFAKMKMEMASDLMEMVADKELEILFLVADAVPEDEPLLLESFRSYPEDWKAGISYGADEVLDMRQTPTFYILGSKGEILAKNLDVNTAVDRIRALKEAKVSKSKK